VGSWAAVAGSLECTLHTPELPGKNTELLLIGFFRWLFRHRDLAVRGKKSPQRFGFFAPVNSGAFGAADHPNPNLSVRLVSRPNDVRGIDQCSIDQNKGVFFHWVGL